MDSKFVTVVDARMGRGKTSAAIRYMNERKGETETPFLYITPYLSEVERVCESCDFEEPDCNYLSKSERLKSLMRRKRNISSTHALFSMMDDEALALAAENKYVLIVDEAPSVMESVTISQKDKDLLLEHFARVNDDGLVVWTDPDYEGKFDGYKKMAESRSLYHCSGSMFGVMDPKKFEAFDEVYILTYIFGGQILRAYFDYFGFRYKVIGVERDDQGFKFSDRPDSPPPVDYKQLIHVYGTVINEHGVVETGGRMNEIGFSRTALSANWYLRRGPKNPEIRSLRNNMRNFFDRICKARSGERLWTTFKNNKEWLYGDRNRYSGDFLPLNTRATNAHKNATRVAYLVNRFVDPNIAKFFSIKGIVVDVDQFALSEMLQFVWRSAIRDNRPIDLYIPSRRMRSLLIEWMDRVSGEGGAHDNKERQNGG